jgi:hypothetical protein
MMLKSTSAASRAGVPPCPTPARLGATTHSAPKAQEVGRKQDRNEEQGGVVVIRSLRVATGWAISALTARAA